MDGIGVVYKPSGITSHDVVDRVRRILKFKKVGHAGTLDPLATGVLIILVGKATKLFDQFVACDKAYTSTMLLGKKTTSADIQGDLVFEKEASCVTEEKIKEIFQTFLGETQQMPPMVSAVFHQGKRLYELARRGVVVQRQPRLIRIDALKVLSFLSPYVKFHLACSKGTYVRQIVDDIGDRLGCGACVTQIERTQVGPFSLKEAVMLEDFNESCLHDISIIKSI